MRFTADVWISDGVGVRSIDGIEDALAYLENWPASDRGPRYFVALSALESAKMGLINPD